MRNIKKKITLLNIISSIVTQMVSIVSALIIPRLILEIFGSNTNGLVSSITQFLNYICLLEGGITGVVAANLYKPLVNGDCKQLSSVLTTARSFYQKIACIFIGYSIIVGLVYPRIVDTGYTDWYVFALTIVLSIGLIMEYMFSLTLTTLLNADKKVYVVSISASILTIINIFLTLFVVRVYPDVFLLKLTSTCLFAIKPLIYGIYVRRKYNIDWRAEKDSSLLKQRWDGFAVNLAFFIHSSTDITLLTLMTDLKTVSVYNVYFLVISKISVVLHAITSGIEPTIGQAYALNDEKKLNEKMDLYEFVILISIGTTFLMTGLLITPFVMVYTHGITDANYYQPIFGVILVLAEATYLLRAPHVSLAYTANKFKELTLPAYIEAIINIVISVVLIRRLGLIGIAIGTLAGMIYRGMFHVALTSKLVSSRLPKNYYKKILVFSVACGLIAGICELAFPIINYSVQSWLGHAIIYGTITVGVLGGTSLVFFKRELLIIKNYIKGK